MPAFHIVLVEPEIPQNAGNIARTCAATGASLHLVRPLGFSEDDRKLKRAGLDYWWLLTSVTYYDGLSDFFARTSGPYFYFSTKGSKIFTDVSYPDGCFLVFGKESAGLPEELLRQNPETTVRLPMRGEARSLNLANTVAAGAYEVLRQWGYPGLLTQGQPRTFRWNSG